MIDYKQVPDTLKAMNQWVCHRKKIPYDPRTGTNAKANDPSTWTDFETAAKAVQAGHYDGIGFELANGIFGVDLDHVVINGQLTPEAQDIITTLDSYTEYSPSGTGAHIICRGDIPTGENRVANVEMYSKGRYFTVTGNAIRPQEVQERTAQAATVHAKYLKRDTPTVKQRGQGFQASSLDDAALLQKAFAAKNGARFKALWEGNTSAYGGDDSRADQALANYLAFWTSGDSSRMDALFRQSGLMRDKWDKRHGADTYGNITIAEALRTLTSFTPEQRQEYKPTSKADAPAELQQAPKGGETHGDGLERTNNDNTEQGNAILFADTYRAKFCYVPEWGWTTWTGKQWDTEAHDTPKLAYMRICDKMRREAASILAEAPEGDEAADKRLKWAIRSRSDKAARGSLSLAQAIMAADADLFDSVDYELNTPAGIVDLRSGVIKPHEPSARCTNMTAYAPADGAGTLWPDFLRYITNGDEALVNYLQEVAGMAAFGKVYHEGIIIAHGPGGNGKSTLFNALAGALGSYAGSIAPELLMIGRNKGDANGLIAVRGKRFILAAETEEGARLSESTMKRLASADPIATRQLYHEGISFTPSHTLVLQTNHLPKISSVDGGTWRRIALVPFTRIIQAERDPIPDYAGVMLKAEGGNIMRWIVDGARRYWANSCRITPPGAVTAATQDYRQAENWIENFIAECCETDTRYTETGSALYSAYRQWAEGTGEYVRRQRDFAQGLTAAGYSCRHTMKGNIWDGLRLLRAYTGNAQPALKAEQSE